MAAALLSGNYGTGNTADGSGIDSGVKASTVKRLRQRHERMRSVRASHELGWKECAKYFAPSRGRWNNQKEESRVNAFDAVYDSATLRARRIAAAGLMAGMTSPARPWFKLDVADEEVKDQPEVRRWLDDATQVLRQVFATTNAYQALHSVFEEIVTFGTAGSLWLPHSERVLHATDLTAGEYSIAADKNNRVTTMFRELNKTVENLVKDYGRSRVSNSVRNLFDKGELDTLIPCIHVIEPRENHRLDSPFATDMPFASYYFESGTHDDKILSESGHQEFPGVFPRWLTVGSAVYGTSVAFDALGDARQLQHAQLQKGRLIDIHTDPELLAREDLKGLIGKRSKGKIYYTDNPDVAVRRLIETNLDPSLLLEDIAQVTRRVNETFYADLFMMLIGDDRNQRATAREVAERHEEKLVMLGPVIERLQDEMLRKVIDLGFSYCVRFGLMPEPPEALNEGEELSVEYTSVLAQAQQMVGAGSVERFAGFVGSIAAIKPEAVDKLNADEMIDKYGRMIGVDPDIVYSDDEVAEVRQQRAQQQAAAQAAEMAAQAATAARDLSSADTEGQNALTDLIGYS